MSEAPGTSLRRSYERARGLDLESQLEECVDHLQHPELLAAELGEAFDAARARVPAAAVPAAPAGTPRFFYASRDIFVVGACDSFTCLAHDLLPPLTAAALQTGEGLDYAAVTCTAEPQPLLGVLQSERDATAYPLLLRGLACLSELSTPAALAELDRGPFRGLLGPAPRFDLHLMVWDDWRGGDEVPARTPISQLSRDLAERAKQALQDGPQAAAILRDIVCLQMNPARFDGRVRFAWRV